MAINLTEWDVVEHLKTEQDTRGYLNACINEADPKLLAAALDDIERARQRNHASSDAELS
jgi:probable addiction module antidote protein